MDRRRLLQWAFTAVFVLFLILLVAKFRPKIEAPAPVDPSQIKHSAEGTLSARGFTYRQETAGKLEFTATADEVTEAPDGVKRLTKPVVTMASGAKAWGNHGTFNPSDSALRIWDDAHLSRPDGWVATSSGFRLTPEGEIVSESHVDLVRNKLTGGAELMRYHRQTQLAHLEGAVHFEEGARSLACTSIDMDLTKHGGTLAGPVTLTAEQGTLKAPAGTIALDEQNRLKSVDLGSPAVGDGPKFACDGKTVTADFDDQGQLAKVHLVGDASVTSKAAPPSTAKSDRFDLTPGADNAWAWVAPGALTVERDGGVSHATSGRGTLGGKEPETAELAGPVTGTDRRGDFKGDRASMKAGDWTLIDHAEAAKPTERVAADRLTSFKDGSSEAEGSVRGWRKGSKEGEADLTYSGDRARSAPGGYPAKLAGHASVIKGGMTLTAPLIKVADERTAVAEGGASGTFVQAGQEGTSVVTAPTIRYMGKDHLATAEGDALTQARGEGKDYTVTGDLLRAVLDDQQRPVRYEAEGRAVFTGALYDGQGDFLSYAPATQMGQAVGRDKDAVVIQKNPYRRLAGPVVDFAPKRLEVLPQGSPRRGSIEGIKPEKKKEPENRGAGEPGKKVKSKAATGDQMPKGGTKQ